MTDAAIKCLYRFRPLYWLLDKGELRNQEIYFAAPEQLNDPMEGFRDIFWNGDAIVWTNFLKHYVVCLDNAFSQWMICGENEALNWSNIPVFNLGNLNDGIPHKALETEVISALLAEPCIQALVAALADRSQFYPIRRDELSAHLRNVHMLAIHHLRQAYVRRGMQPEAPEANAQADAFRGAVTTMLQSLTAIQAMGREQPIDEHQIDAFYLAQSKMIGELDFIHFYNGDFNVAEANRAFVCVTFPQEFVRKVETLIYPDWYTACFMRDCRNSAVWGTYGDNHRAVCLQFRVDRDGDRPGLHLKRPAALNRDGPVLDFVNHEFHEITYESKHLPIDFFRSLGRLPISVLRRHWYSDRAGNQSPCGDDIFRADYAWRARYWEAFYHGITRKLDDWSHEKEHRLIIDNMHWDYRETTQRTLPYRFSDLTGIVFGIKTPLKAKVDICRIIEEKCRSEGRTDFKFYQAYYARKSGTIEHAEMTFLKFKDLGGSQSQTS
jgi:hypothetical protein